MEIAEDQAKVEENTDEQVGKIEETSEVVLTNEAEESALLENEEPMEEEGLQQTSESLLEENDTQETSDAAAVSGEAEGNDAVVEDSKGSGIGGEAAKEEEEEEEEINLPDSEMPQVNVTTLAKRKWQVKIYPLKPDDFVNGQVAKVFSNAKESLLYIYTSGKYNGGKGEMYVSTEVQAAKVVQNLMKLDFKSQNINIEIIRKNSEGVVEEKAFMRFDAKLIRILCVPSFRSRRMGNRREQLIGSVFVKNLPISTSKDMLRVMFPFASAINYNPEKFTDGTARLVLNARSAVGPCLKGFTKLELAGSLLEMRPLQKKEKSQSSGDKASTKTTEATGEAGDETESKPSDSKKDGKASSDKTGAKPTAAKKSPAASKSEDDKKDKKEDAAKPRVPSRNPRAQGANRYRNNPRDNRRDFSSSTFRPRGGNFGQRGLDRYRFRAAGFGNRFRPEDRRMRMPGAGREAGIDTGAAKEMLLLQSQLSVAIKNQLSMLNQTQFALQQAKQEAATISFSREAGQGSSSGLLNRRMSNQQRSEQPRIGQTRAGQARGGQTRAGQVRGGQTRGGQLRAGQVRTDNRRQQNKRGKPRERRTEEQRFGGGAAEYSYKRNATMAGLSTDYGATGMGKRRSFGGHSDSFGGHNDSFGGHSNSFGGHNESHSWADDRAATAFGHSQAPAFGYPEFEDREAEFQSLHTSPRSLNYNNSSYGYRY